MIAHVEGAGNAFVLVWSEEAPGQELFGLDGLVWLRSSPLHAASMRFFNPDGKEAALCGNGLRCAAHFLIEVREEKPPFTIESASGKHAICREEGLIGVEMPRATPFDQVVLEGVEFFTTQVGVPHAYHITSQIENFDLEALGRAFVHHSHFSEGTNVNVLEYGDRLKLRTYERGVNRETLACGTGAVGAAALAKRSQAIVEMPGGKLEVRGDFLFGPTKMVLLDKQNIC